MYCCQNSEYLVEDGFFPFVSLTNDHTFPTKQGDFPSFLFCFFFLFLFLTSFSFWDSEKNWSWGSNQKAYKHKHIKGTFGN